MRPDDRLFTYKLTHDSGFAPNPFGGMLTLATCKSDMRKSKKVGQWVAGFTSDKLNKHERVKRGRYDIQKLIYLMEITNKITFSEYWNNEKYHNRKPKNINSNIIMERTGDNIYKPNPSSVDNFEQIENLNHGEDSKDDDLNGKYVLVSERFYYFGCNPLEIPHDIRPKIPPSQHGQGNVGFKDDKGKHDNARQEAFLSWIESNYKMGIHDKPHMWFENDETYKLDILYVGGK